MTGSPPRATILARAARAAAAVAADGLEDVNSDIHASEAYHRAMVKVFTRRAIEKAAGR